MPEERPVALSLSQPCSGSGCLMPSVAAEGLPAHSQGSRTSLNRCCSAPGPASFSVARGRRLVLLRLLLEGFPSLPSLYISDSIACSRSQSSFPQFTYNLLRIGMMSLPSRGCWGCGRGESRPLARWLSATPMNKWGCCLGGRALLWRWCPALSAGSHHAILPFAEWDFQWLQEEFAVPSFACDICLRGYALFLKYPYGREELQQLDHMPCKISASIDPSLIWGSRALDSLHTKLMPACASPSFSIGSLGLLALRFRFQYPGNLSLFAAILGAVQGILAVVKLGSVVSGLFALWPSAFLPIPLLDHIFIVLTPGICYPGMKPESSHWEL